MEVVRLFQRSGQGVAIPVSRGFTYFSNSVRLNLSTFYGPTDRDIRFELII